MVPPKAPAPKRPKIDLGAIRNAAASLEAANEARKSREQKLVDSLTPAEQERYAAWKKSSFYRKGQAKCAMRRLLKDICEHDIHERTLIVMCAAAKLFVGDVVETARAIAQEQGHEGPLATKHLKSAYLKLAAEAPLPSTRGKRKHFVR